MKTEILKKAQKLIDSTDNNICNHCLGRKFSDVLDLDGNLKRGEEIRKNLKLDNPQNQCPICNDIFNQINEDLIEKIDNKINYLGIEFETFLVGSMLSKDIIENDETLDETFDFEVEPLKKELNREIGKLLENHFKKEVEFDSQDIVINIDFKKFLEDKVNVRVQINPIFIEGKYNKFIRGIPQTKWPCRKCKGRGCDECNDTGKQYVMSVEELISERFLKESKGYEAKFHGAGREDIDVKMLGSGRPFVLEIKEPKVRNLDLSLLEKEINTENEGKTAYHNLKFVKRNRKAEIKVSSPDTFKVYRALVVCEEDYDIEKLEKLKSLDKIEQFTPLRVEHRRAKKVRAKHVKNIEANVIDSKQFEIIVKTEGGLYIKELISGDGERTKPSIADLLDVGCVCAQLDVIEVSEK
ncbi:tRNA pseudouridine(54/55) synthase Pus10 [Methanobrevibacter sp. DSM 116169]|uniref:tRNA pseudouridine(54/55) synthase Pus10 n=1 Tax=Methanobrevibacter sp. DSM 116169 TaxID=3242727 RepID=UPI0038FBFC6A